MKREEDDLLWCSMISYAQAKALNFWFRVQK